MTQKDLSLNLANIKDPYEKKERSRTRTMPSVMRDE